MDEGCFLSAEDLNDIIERWRSKKNIVLQGLPGTGKTWLAKRLGFALVGSNDRETTRSRLRTVQFHPSLAYEDFVRRCRPCGDGKLALVDGILMEAFDAQQVNRIGHSYSSLRRSTAAIRRRFSARC